VNHLRSALIALLVLGGVLGVTATPDAKRPHHIEEDEPGWDCTTMGNRICGPGH
jgi:hypothetical protein